MKGDFREMPDGPDQVSAHVASWDRRGFLLASLSGLAACSGIGPDYVPPTITLTDSFAENAAAQTGDVAVSRWWTELGDQKLNDLVARGLAQNLSVTAALQAVDEARANARAAGLGNQISGGVRASVTGVDVSEDALGIIPDQVRSATLSAGTALAGMDRRQEAALAGLEAAELDVGTARLAYLSSLVGAYIDARYFQETLELTRQSIVDNTRILRIVERERSLGQAAELDVARAKAQLASVSAEQPSLESAFLANVYGIAALLSEPAEPLIKTLQAGAPQPIPRSAPQVGTPANLLRNRPDIRATERRYASAVAAIGVAEAQLYPTLTLSGTISASDSLDASLFGPSLALPVFNRGALTARRDAAKATAQKAETAWRASVLGAVRDVQTAQSAYRLSRRRVSQLQEAVSATRTAFTLTERAFEDGAIPLLDLLSAELTLTEARVGLAQAVQQSASEWLALQIATGSGWASVSRSSASAQAE
ncbi:efflux transporter outer membrane subunit [uncultured Marivita sp.]|uniref:efflux transporter outer membrane subunit n=1 Tax=uncultured Marivita sp. TaxID=888080 RepID=UPI0026268926|nr:efflux transporter outer membrane subunit [uncultured Marivita sp.]